MYKDESKEQQKLEDFYLPFTLWAQHRLLERLFQQAQITAKIYI